jgi:hypothetical protein
MFISPKLSPRCKLTSKSEPTKAIKYLTSTLYFPSTFLAYSTNLDFTRSGAT